VNVIRRSGQLPPEFNLRAWSGEIASDQAQQLGREQRHRQEAPASPSVRDYAENCLRLRLAKSAQELNIGMQFQPTEKLGRASI